MSDRSPIEWTEATWNPLRGCSRVSAGCQHCYAERVAARFSGRGMPYEGLIHPSTRGWNGTVRVVPEVLDQPLRWKRPRRIFVNSMSDLFHESVPDNAIAAIFGIMAASPQHTFQVLTKRPQRALTWFATMTDPSAQMHECVKGAMGYHHPNRPAINNKAWPLPNVWLGVSVENQATAAERILLLLQCPATVRWLSCEPLLGPIEFGPYTLTERPCFVCRAEDETGAERGSMSHPINCGWRHDQERAGTCKQKERWGRGIDWVVAGGESGPGARPMHPDWARSLRDQCAEAGVPFFFKQWGEWLPVDMPSDEECFADDGSDRQLTGRIFLAREGTQPMARTGKKYAGRLLDGIEHNAYPEVYP